ncbi:TetR/AcrR family transcriptional regulator [Streptomyces coeruleoprunus]|uniref:TetR/AcrR family transcriptional regulator n=1 Tax=Streptomyces coeruleoprunus TaxID=285563 RepID=A0ABV9XR06_9ACTN
MPTAREALLDAALAALADLPWSAVRMVDVAAAAGLSRQTLYNEFGSKDGLARALVRREADACLAAVERAAAAGPPGDAAERLAALADWLVARATARPLLRALLTGCWGTRLPEPPPARPRRTLRVGPAQRRADAGTPGPGELLEEIRDRARPAPDATLDTEVALRLALSHLVAPAARGQGPGPLVRAALGATRPAVSATNPTAGAR